MMAAMLASGTGPEGNEDVMLSVQTDPQEQAHSVMTPHRIPLIRCDYPGGNVRVLGIDNARGVVEIAPDMRDSANQWFHWDFTLSGAEGRTLRFQFPDGFPYLASLGPAISRDGGATWRWLHADGSRHEPANAFDYAFAPDETENRFAKSIPYTQRDWDAFLARISACGANTAARDSSSFPSGRRMSAVPPRESLRVASKSPDLLPGVLCPSQSGRRDTELLRIPCRGTASWLFVFTARHHACEASANPVMEGVVEGILSDTAEGRWMRANADCLFVPFMDKDGVEDGDQGKDRIPHDHNRDYVEERYTSVRALKRLVEKESRGRRLVFIDMHSPFIRSVNGSSEHDHVYTFGCGNSVQNAHWNRFREHWAEMQRGGALVYDGSFDIPAGEGYDRQIAADCARGLMASRAWALSLPQCHLATTCEFGYSLCGGVYSPDAARELGRNLLRALQRTAAEP